MKSLTMIRIGAPLVVGSAVLTPRAARNHRRRARPTRSQVGPSFRGDDLDVLAPGALREPGERRPLGGRVQSDAPAPIAQSTREAIAAAVVAVGGALTIALWLQDTPTGSLRTLGDQFTAVGRLTGLVGTYLVLVQVLLMARLPWLDRLVGADRLAVWHRRNGEYVVGLLVVHAVATIAGYALSDHRSLPWETGAVVLRYPDVLAGTVALGLLVAIGVTSARAVRRRMAYHTWYFVHLYAYLAVVLAFPHQLADGNDFVGHPWHRVFWVVVHLGTAALLVAYRLVVPLRSALRHRLRVTHVVDEGPGVVSIYLGGEHLDELDAEPGQFFLWRFLTRHGWWQAHPFSLSSAPNGRFLRITVKDSGDFTRALHDLPVGTRVIAEGPMGAITPRRRSQRKVLLVAGGIGVAPLRSLFEALPAAPGDVTFLYRARDRRDLVLWSELEELARRRGARLGYVVGPRDQHPDPLAADNLRAAIPDLAAHDVFVCGPPGFVDHVAASLRSAGVPRRRVHAERFEL
jgi:predicted ferric reductase